MKKPVRNEIYTLKEIVSELMLPDRPHLMYFDGEDYSPIQNDDIESLVESDALIAASRWQFRRITDEGCPLFYAYKLSELEALVTCEPSRCPYRKFGETWVYFKAQPIEQEYTECEDGIIVHVPTGLRYKPPVFNENGERTARPVVINE